jgi:hypothetical protein
LISIVPTANGEDAQPARPDLLSELSDKVTGRSLLVWRLPSRPFTVFLKVCDRWNFGHTLADEIHAPRIAN